MDMERALLGSMLLNNNQFYLIADYLTEADFFSEFHKRLFSHLALRIPANVPVDMLTLNRLPENDRDAMGGIPYLAQLADQIGNIPMPERLVYHYANRIKRASNLRLLAATAVELAHLAEDQEGDPAEIVQTCQQRFTSVIHNSPDSTEPATAVGKEIEDRLQSCFAGAEISAILPTGFKDINTQVGGFRRGELSIIGARPSVGKSALLGNLLDNMSEFLQCGFASVEMAAGEIYLRQLAKRLNRNVTDLELGAIPVADQRAVFNESFKLRQRKFWIDDSGTQTIAHIANSAQRAKITRGLDVLFVDYLQLVKFHPPKNIRFDRKDIVAEVTHGLKALAKDLNIAVVAAAQLNRDAREDAEPGLHNLRECGDIEQDADLIAFLWLDQKVHTLSIAKNRNGKRGARIPLSFTPERAAFYDFTRQQQ